MSDVRQVIGTYEINGETREVAVTLAASGAFWTTDDGSMGGRDFRHRGPAVNHLKKTLSRVPVVWAD